MSAGAQQSVSSGETERASHQAAAHMGQGEGGRVSYRRVYSNRDLVEGRDLILMSRSFLRFLQKCFSKSHVSRLFQMDWIWPSCPGPLPFPLLSHFSSLLFSFPILTHTNTPMCLCPLSSKRAYSFIFLLHLRMLHSWAHLQ